MDSEPCESASPLTDSIRISQVLQAMPEVRTRINPKVAPYIAVYLLAVAARYEERAKQPARRGDRLNRLRLRGERVAAQRVIDAVALLCDALLETVSSEDVWRIADIMGVELPIIS